MPYVKIRITPNGLTDAERLALARRATDVMAEVLAKRRDLVAVEIVEREPGCWFIGGRSLVGAQGKSAYVEAKITEGTNSPSQKAEAVLALNAMLKDVLGNVEQASYVTLHEVPADAWGYDGRTQASRMAEKR